MLHPERQKQDGIRIKAVRRAERMHEGCVGSIQIDSHRSTEEAKFGMPSIRWAGQSKLSALRVKLVGVGR